MIVAKHILPLKTYLAKYAGYTCLLVTFLCKPSLPLHAQRLPVIPAGADAYLEWDQWPMQRIGMRTYMRSTYDRTGGNDAADASHYLFMNGETDNVTLDITGTGILYFFRANHWHGSPWHFITDGREHTIQETGTADPANAIRDIKASVFIPAAPFPKPLAWTWADTKGADLIWTPIPFRQSLRIAYSRTHYGTGYYIYQLFADPGNLSRRIRSWDINKTPEKKMTDLISKAGQDIAPLHIPIRSGTVKLSSERVTLTDIREAAVVRALKLTIPVADAEALERLRLLVTWDDAPQPSIDAPLCLFFGAGTLHNRDNREYLVKGFPINIRYDSTTQQVTLACYYPMPFFKAAKFELAGITPGEAAVNYEIRYQPQKINPAFSSYFHATYRDFPTPELGKDLTLLDTRGMEGKTEWSGNFVGTSFIFTHNGELGTLEGDPRFFFDDSRSPQAQGTGTEEWGGGGDYWGGRNMTLPFAGHPCGVARKEQARNEKDLIHSAYRFLLADLMPFGRNARIQLEHGGDNRSTEHYESVTYWYGLPAPSLVKTDELDIGDSGSEQQHVYHSPQASPVETIISRYELGPDSLNVKGKGKIEVYPAHKEDGRYTRGVSAFNIRLDPANQGALLRRTLDYSHPNQKAAVYIADSAGRKWKFAGTWYLAGANTCMFSHPPKETDKRMYNVQTSNRRFRDDEWLIPAALTKGRSNIRVKIVFEPVEQELYPGYKFPGKNAWSELRYTAYSYIVPVVKD